MGLTTTDNVYFYKSILHVSSFMYPEEIPIASRVCKQWWKAFDNRSVWKQQYQIQGYSVEPEIAEHLVGFAEGKLSFKIVQIIASYDESRAIDYKRVFAKGVKAFGTNAWNSFCKNPWAVSYVPRPYNMRQFNNQPCPYWPEHRRGDTGVWTLIPEQVSQIEMSIAKHENLSKVKLLSNDIKSTEKWAPTGETRWLYRTCIAVPESDSKSLQDHQHMAASHGDRLPTLAEIVHSMIAEHIQNGNYPFPKNHWNFIRTGSITTDKQSNWSVGCFGSDGLRIMKVDFDATNRLHIAAVREF